MASTIKVNNIQNQCGANIINESANTITIGASGDTIQLAAGASQTGFGRTGTVDWDTTAKTANFTAVSGTGYFVNTTSGAITVTTPASPSAGDIFSLADYAATWNTNNLTIAPNGTDKIGGRNDNATLSTQGQSVTFVYVDSTQGWINTMDSTSNVRGLGPFIEATGGTVTCCGDYKIHTFTGPGTFTVTNAGTPAGSTTVDYLVVAAGGGGGAVTGGGGGGGGFRESKAPTAPWTASPLATCASLPVSTQAYPITIGSGGNYGTNAGQASTPGSNSVFSTITSTGGGAGGGSPNSTVNLGQPGGSGGGGGGYVTPCGPNVQGAGVGNTPPVSPPQGNPGGGGRNYPGSCNASAGGGGATEAGTDAVIPYLQGRGGAGATTSISGTSLAYAGGGGGGNGNNPHCSSPCGTGGAGGFGPNTPGVNGTTNRGGGGGGGGYGSSCLFGGQGGSGVVIIRYKFQ